MTDDRLGEAVSDVAVARIREARKTRGWRTSDLAGRCAETGHPELTRAVLENIESGRRQDGRRTRHITVDELYALARALECKPGQLLPGDSGDTAFTFDAKTYDELISGLEAAKHFVDLQRWRDKTGQ